jgi:subtilase family serine protease
VTATNRFGSTSAETSNFFYDMAGYPFAVRDKEWVHNHLQYSPDQLRAWYGLSPEENGSGQTIVVTEPWHVSRGLHALVSHFSAHYGLPRPCPSRSGPSPCFKLSVLGRGRRPGYADNREVDLDVEWAHAIAPAATIDVLQAPTPESWIPFIVHRTRAHVFSSSWSLPPRASRDEARAPFIQLDRACNVAHIVCTWSSGDEGHPGRTPANSPGVLAVGGTVFRSIADGTTGPEKAWRYSGGGTTLLPQPRPAWQRQLTCDPFDGACGDREIPDVSATAEAVPQYDAGQIWHIGSGTSLGAPLWAALIALADQKLAQTGQSAIGIGELHRVLYRGDISAALDDVGKTGWDAQTGWGSPKRGIVDVLTKAIERYRQEG